LEKELKVTLKCLRRPVTSIAKLVPQVIIISNSTEEVEIKPQHAIGEQLQSTFASRHVEEEELQQLVVEK
jgi:hypothetical protein